MEKTKRLYAVKIGRTTRAGNLEAMVERYVETAADEYKLRDYLAAIEPTVEVVTMLKPFYNFKAAEGGRRR